MLKKCGVKVIGVQTILARTDSYKGIEKEHKVRISFLEKEEEYEDIYSKPLNAPWTYSNIPKEIKELINKKILRKGMDVLEIGCGEGHQAIFLAKKGLNVIATDASKNAIKFAKENAKKKNVKVIFRQMDYHQVKSIKKKFDFIYDWRFFMSIIDERERNDYLKMIRKLLKHGGKYLSVDFSGDSDFMGKGKLRISPIGVKIYFARLKDSEGRFGKYFKILDSKWIKVPQKPNLKIKANYILAEKS